MLFIVRRQVCMDHDSRLQRPILCGSIAVSNAGKLQVSIEYLYSLFATRVRVRNRNEQEAAQRTC